VGGLPSAWPLAHQALPTLLDTMLNFRYNIKYL